MLCGFYMIDLKCKLNNCIYNKDSNCNAKQITVDSKASCSSFHAKKKFEKQPDNTPMPFVRSAVDVNCKVDCLFNKNGKCIANGISMCDEKGSQKQADCSTYMPS